MTTYEFETVPYATLKTGDRVKIANTYHGVFVDWAWRVFPVDHVKWLRDDRTALMLYLTEPLPCGDRFALVTGRAAIDAGAHRIVREITEPRYRVRTLSTDPSPSPLPLADDEFQPVHGSYTDRSEADARCADLNART
ncbi:hypothetical protein [Streptomyces olivaceus]